MKNAIVAFILLALTLFAASAASATAQLGAADQSLYLRRMTFDPLKVAPTSAIASADSSSRLRLLQFASVPTAAMRARLAVAGYHTLLYIPINALLVRADAHPQALAALPELRWSGVFPAAYKLPPGLDAALSGQMTGTIDLQILTTPDADTEALARDVDTLGGSMTARNTGLNGTVLRVLLPAIALRTMLSRDDVLWVEPAFTPMLANDRARTILGVAAAEQRLGWLTGAGQLIAVADTGLDVQQTVEANANPDFRSNRIAAAFGPAQMSDNCAGLQDGANWSDYNGHGTHVAGSALGGGRPGMTPVLAGMAPGARLVVQAVSSGGDTLDCLDLDNGFLSKAYDAGARIQNGSWGRPTGSGSLDQSGGYTAFEQIIDEFLWNHKQHLFVVVAGNSGIDDKLPAGVIDPDSIDSPGTAKNVLTVGSSENDRPPTSAICSSFDGSGKQENQCYGTRYGDAPIAGDFVSDHAEGLAAFSGRGPTDDGRIKPEIVAPGTNIVSTASHAAGTFYRFGKYTADYAYDNGTSMSAPLVSGLAALT
ncbi:MAG: S8 family serine peptidase, partial [Roseiflexaceae bacterium]